MKKTKKISLMIHLWILTLIMGLMVVPPQEIMAQTHITIVMDGEPLRFTEATGRPFIDENNRTLVPFRITLESFGAQVHWDGQNRIATAYKNGITVQVPIGQPFIMVDGDRVPNDTQAVIAEDGRTYLPIRKVLEAFDALVHWQESSQTIFVASPPPPGSEVFPEEIPPEPIEPALPDEEEDTSISQRLEERLKRRNASEEQEKQRLTAALEENTTLIRDPALFTLYAFMNYTGYEEENNPAGFHPVRKAILKDLKAMDLQLTEPRYYRQKGLPYSKYISALSEMDNRLRYKEPRRIQALLPELAELDQRLQEFSEQADILTLYEKYREEYLQAIAMYHPEMYAFLAQYTQFLRVSPQEVPEFYFVVNLQESYWRGYFLVENYGPLDNASIMVLGPSDQMNHRLLAHEYLHSILTPIHADLAEEIESLSHMMRKVPQGSQARNAVYDTWFTIFDESMIRALDSWFVNTNQEELIRQEVEAGFILTEYFYHRFQEDWEDFHGTLEDFIREMIRDLQ
ncbi:copper amine oxidase N-terminal domain-containing protein [Tindallia californiensis]|uniref:Copper amine oxidase-like N-terminal domain-containing protein n=1 Tax=Tindallia californiensis TaxID=159292 RepID=A0A1H3PF88_9FIRM|nr:copper amine oxidase N-terminal domain-containing protein [Tindallia californiensis]SDY99750.1 protein of unknown function [Tindallia californiensis]